jgi:hypothetical protein
MLGLIITNKAIKEKCVGIFRFFDGVVEATSNNNVLDSTKISGLSLQYIIFKLIIVQKLYYLDSEWIMYSLVIQNLILMSFLNLKEYFNIKFIKLFFIIRNVLINLIFSLF